jgi:hypothetical protein
VSSRGRVLVYDYQEGYVIDAETGEVVDRIFDYSPPSRGADTCSRSVERDARQRREFKSSYERYKEHYRVYREARRLEERGFVVDYSRLFTVGFKNSLRRRASVAVEQRFRELGLLPELEEILEEVGERAPHVLARSRRAQLLIAYALRELRAGRWPSYSQSPVKDLVHESLFRTALKIAQGLYKALYSGGGERVAEASTG